MEKKNISMEIILTALSWEKILYKNMYKFTVIIHVLASKTQKRLAETLDIDVCDHKVLHVLYKT